MFVTSYMRCGSTWLCDILTEIYNTEKFKFIPKGYNLTDSDFVNKFNEYLDNDVVKIHWVHPKVICNAIDIADRKDIYVVSITRNIYDVIVSLAMYIRYDKHLNKLNRLSHLYVARRYMKLKYGDDIDDKSYINKFVFTPFALTVIRYWLIYEDGYYHSNHLRVTYEQLYYNPLDTIKHLSDFLRVDVNIPKLIKIYKDTCFKVVSGGRAQGVEDNKSFRRKGIVGDWKNYLTEDSILYIDKMLEKLSRIGGTNGITFPS